MYHTEPPTDKTIREWYMNSSRVAACALRNEQAVRAHRPEELMNNPVLPCVSCHPDNLATYSLFSQLGEERAECHSLALLFSEVDFAVGGHVLCTWGRVG